MEKKDRTELAGTGQSGRQFGTFLKKQQQNQPREKSCHEYFHSELFSCTLNIGSKRSFNQDQYPFSHPSKLKYQASLCPQLT